MLCSTNRKRLQEWFDKPVSPLPRDVAAHVKQCTNCRTLVTRWNAIELQIQSMKNEGPELAPDFADTVRRRLREPDVPRPWQMPFLAWRAATLCAAAMVVLAAVLYVLGGMRILNPVPHPESAAVVPAPGNHAPLTAPDSNK